MKILFKAILLAAFALLLGTSPAMAGGDPEAGKAKSATCAGCHGADGMGIDPNPPLAGLDEAFFAEQIAAFKSGARDNAMMKMFADQLSDEDVANLAAYYASLGAD